jgi:hypothetical protein
MLTQNKIKNTMKCLFKQYETCTKEKQQIQQLEETLKNQKQKSKQKVTQNPLLNTAQNSRRKSQTRNGQKQNSQRKTRKFEFYAN